MIRLPLDMMQGKVNSLCNFYSSIFSTFSHVRKETNRELFYFPKGKENKLWKAAFGPLTVFLFWFRPSLNYRFPKLLL